jgi:hypothetical protein
VTAGERLVALAGHSGTAGALLLAIGSGATAGAALVNYSRLSSATAGEHLLVERGSAINYWTGSAWVLKPVKRYDGASWVSAMIKRWNGSLWI